MVAVQFNRWVSQGFAVDDSCTDPDAVHTALAALARIAGVVEAQRVVCARVLARCSIDPGGDLATGSRTGRRDAVGVMERVAIIDRAPQLGDALTAGEVSAGHVDRLGGALNRLDPALQDRLLGELPALVDVARQTDGDGFERHLRRRERELQADDGQRLFERQQRAVRLQSWIDRQTSMYCLKLAVDPKTGVGLDNRLRAMTETLFHNGDVPEYAPADPVERQQFLRAHALMAMLNGERVRLGRPEHIIIEDRRTPTGSPPVFDVGLPVELPAGEIRAMLTDATIHHVVVDRDVVVDAPGVMNLGRTRRLASEPQRRVLRALYATCAVPGCHARFDDCTIHHIRWWRPPHNGTTNLDNLIPVCSVHHHHIHDRGWTLTLHPDRTLHINRPGLPDLHGHPNRTDRTLQHTHPAPPAPPAGVGTAPAELGASP